MKSDEILSNLFLKQEWERHEIVQRARQEIEELYVALFQSPLLLCFQLRGWTSSRMALLWSSTRRT